MQILSLDAITMNHDRHVENLTLWQIKDGTWRTAPVFDNGCALDNTVREEGDLEKPLSTFLRTKEKHKFWALDDYVRLIKVKTGLEGKPALRISKTAVGRIKNYECNIYAQSEVEKCRRVLLDRLSETEGILWTAK